MIEVVAILFILYFAMFIIMTIYLICVPQPRPPNHLNVQILEHTW